MKHARQARCKILVVEDDALIADMIGSLLGMDGYDPLILPSGGDALTALLVQQDLPSLILLDLAMRDIDGPSFRAVQRTNPAWSQIPVILISALPGVAMAASDLNVADYLQKPFDPAQLLALVRRYCSVGEVSGCRPHGQG